MNDWKSLYNEWTTNALEDKDLIKELEAIRNDEIKIKDAFYQDLKFGTGGLRGKIGAGTNRMNVYTVAKATQGLASYIIHNFPKNQHIVAISYDSRVKSDLFAKVTAGVFAANNIKVSIYSTLMPVPCLSYAVRQLHCAAGVMITASHNPSVYNGYKVYGNDGCQITTEAAKNIQSEIAKVDIFQGVKRKRFDEGIYDNTISYIPEVVFDQYVKDVKEETLLHPEDHVDKNVNIIYTPLNGSGLVPVLRVLKESGYNNITVVKEQEKPDGLFPTCPYPNPEVREAMELGVAYAKKYDADLLLATDPDCDRVGIAVKDNKDNYVLLTANETGMLLLDFICKQRIKYKEMPVNPVFMKTIVTIDMAERIASKYGLRTVNTLTGFKFIGEQIGLLEKEGRKESYIFGFEESYGYLSGTYVRDKDGVNASLLICDMFSYYKSHGISLYNQLNKLYDEYGYCLNTQHSFKYEGPSGMERMQSIMDNLRQPISMFGDKKVLKTNDYSIGVDGLPKSNVIKFFLQDHCSIVVRPSGTEPKLKIYISISAKDKSLAQKEETKLFNELRTYLD